ncbi:S-adenosyl-L-methionine-dependent methyltransferase [Durotheca rogersii]|uniref:S-adenosyl-L-methionine-dependent methyltransferase n=1 Tax=Durotheca rogersii TaxID=419775 RepID=UPI00221EA1E4|nr:S-adenosyl-L-methionine-dependent methyltransferase [Durotheca rogersii]KAI5862340.1 S-adenosyl-L-methionine-dependent methyltransferase [Durotheca rogersii]
MLGNIGEEVLTRCLPVPTLAQRSQSSRILTPRRQALSRGWAGDELERNKKRECEKKKRTRLGSVREPTLAARPTFTLSMRQEMQAQEQQRHHDLAAGSAGLGAMERPPDHHHVGDSPAASAADTTATATAPTAIANYASPIRLQQDRTHHHRHQEEEEVAVMLTAGQVHHDDDQLAAEPAISTSSHGAAKGVGRARERDHDDHVSSAQANGCLPASTDLGAADVAAAVATSDNTASSSSAYDAAETYEQHHVHSVYESIATHFSSTRYKPWPLVASFLASLPPGSVGLDVGCGNGKYLGVNPDLFIIGSDRSASLARLACDRTRAAVTADGGGDRGSSSSSSKGSSCADVVGIADGLALPFGGGRRRVVDFAICIAVVHHLSTRERRVAAVRALLDGVAPGAGRVLVYVWALEQGGSRRGWDESTADQDQLVPWVLKSGQPGGGNKSKGKKSRKGMEEKTGAVASAEGGGGGAEIHGDGGGGKVDDTRDDNTRDDNRSNRSPEDRNARQQPGGAAAAAVADKTYQRYYHLYRRGELEEDVAAAGGEVLASGYEKDNWWAVAARPGAAASAAVGSA